MQIKGYGEHSYAKSIAEVIKILATQEQPFGEEETREVLQGWTTRLVKSIIQQTIYRINKMKL